MEGALASLGDSAQTMFLEAPVHVGKRQVWARSSPGAVQSHCSGAQMRARALPLLIPTAQMQREQALPLPGSAFSSKTLPGPHPAALAGLSPQPATSSRGGSLGLWLSARPAEKRPCPGPWCCPASPAGGKTQPHPSQPGRSPGSRITRQQAPGADTVQKEVMGEPGCLCQPYQTHMQVREHQQAPGDPRVPGPPTRPSPPSAPTSSLPHGKVMLLPQGTGVCVCVCIDLPWPARWAPHLTAPDPRPPLQLAQSATCNPCPSAWPAVRAIPQPIPPGVMPFHMLPHPRAAPALRSVLHLSGHHP